jgi:hypothetical protein
MLENLSVQNALPRPCVERLPFNLQNEQQVIFSDSIDLPKNVWK